MGNSNKRKGTAFESACRDYLNVRLGMYVADWKDADCPFKDPRDPNNVIRPVQMSQRDSGDLHCWPVIVQCKDVASPSVPKWLTAAAKQAAAAGFPYSAVVHKRRRMGVAAAHVYLAHATYSQVMAKLGAYGFGAGYGFTHGHLGRYMATDLRNFADLLRDLRAPLSAPSRADG